jgi:Anti-sigma factor NepR
MDTGVKLGRDVIAAIGRELRVRYADIVAEGVPERFAEILRRLDASSVESAGRDDPAPD